MSRIHTTLRLFAATNGRPNLCDSMLMTVAHLCLPTALWLFVHLSALPAFRQSHMLDRALIALVFICVATYLILVTRYEAITRTSVSPRFRAVRDLYMWFGSFLHLALAVLLRPAVAPQFLVAAMALGLYLLGLHISDRFPRTSTVLFGGLCASLLALLAALPLLLIITR